jgi:hypothetical protein
MLFDADGVNERIVVADAEEDGEESLRKTATSAQSRLASA